jgi:hypothetical protein
LHQVGRHLSARGRCGIAYRRAVAEIDKNFPEDGAHPLSDEVFQIGEVGGNDVALGQGGVPQVAQVAFGRHCGTRRSGSKRPFAREMAIILRLHRARCCLSQVTRRSGCAYPARKFSARIPGRKK